MPQPEKSINRALNNILPDLLKDMQIVHITGTLDWDEIKENVNSLTETEQRNYRVFPFLHDEMGAALRSADLVVSRSGASILGEYPMFSFLALMVPHPHACRHQKTNAEYLARQNAAEIIAIPPRSELTGDTIIISAVTKAKITGVSIIAWLININVMSVGYADRLMPRPRTATCAKLPSPIAGPIVPRPIHNPPAMSFKLWPIVCASIA